jgi:hypothetical protein
MDGSAAKACLENKVMCFTRWDYDLRNEGPHGSILLQGNALLRWKMFLPQLYITFIAVFWEQFDERFWEK